MATAQAEERGQGQSTVEWIGLLTLVLALLAGLGAIAGERLPGGDLARALIAKVLCAASLSESCTGGSEGALQAAYGPELAAEVERQAPELVYEPHSSALPVDFRSCRGARCGNGAHSGPISRSQTGEPATAFVHVVDCRRATLRAIDTAAAWFRCLGPAMGNLYIQYWLYYEDSSSLKDLQALGGLGFHQDDWKDR